jgi:O-methyltransferase involved in polyketide biosynthesis
MAGACGGMAGVADKDTAPLGAVQQTLFIPLAARARAAQRRHPLLRDPKAVQIAGSVEVDPKYGRGAGGSVTVLRTVLMDAWVRDFLVRNPAGTVVEIGSGLNSRFERVDNGQAHWIDLDLPDSIELRRKFFADTDRRQMVAASVTGEEWLPLVAQRPGPYFFVADGVLVYLTEEQVSTLLTRIKNHFPNARIALDTFPQRTLDQQRKLAARRGIPARFAWACDDPRSLERLGLRVVESTGWARLPGRVRRHLPAAYRFLLPLADPLVGQSMRITLLQA